MPDPIASETLDKAVTAAAVDKSLTCAEAFAMARRLGVSPARIGQAVDHRGIRLRRCQLGLFGHSPDKKAIEVPGAILPALAAAIADASAGGPLACIDAWRIADQFGWSKPAVAGACDQMAVKIKPCQLGAF